MHLLALKLIEIRVPSPEYGRTMCFKYEGKISRSRASGSTFRLYFSGHTAIVCVFVCLECSQEKTKRSMTAAKRLMTLGYCLSQ
jgi:hypothetical protein